VVALHDHVGAEHLAEALEGHPVLAHPDGDGGARVVGVLVADGDLEACVSETGICGASALGRSTLMPAWTSGAVTMKMMSSTSITSTRGVTLMSLIGPLRRCRRWRRPLGGASLRRRYFRMCRRTMLRKSLAKMSISVDSTRIWRTK
jgi:hypothetical protein